MKPSIKRKYGEKQTYGTFFIEENGVKEAICKTLELPWLNNQRNISCIPELTYQVIKHYSPTFGKSFWIQDVPERSEILIHVANFVGSDNPKTGHSDLRGCVAPGTKYIDIDGDGLKDIASSKVALNKLWDRLPQKFELIIQ